MVNKTLGWRTPVEVLTGLAPDVSLLLYFYFYKPLLYKRFEYLYPSQSNEREGFYVGPTQNVGHKLYFKILMNDTQQIIYWSSICLALSLCYCNLCFINQARGEMTDGSNYIFIKSQHPKDNKLYDPITGFLKRMPSFSHEELIEKTYLYLLNQIGNNLEQKSSRYSKTKTMIF